MNDKQTIRKSPSSIEAEKAVLGCMLINEQAMYRALHNLKPNSFYDNSHKIIFKAMSNMFEKGKTVDSITLIDYLKKNKDLKKVGDSYYITGLVEEAPSSENVDHYAEIVKQKEALKIGLVDSIVEYSEAMNTAHKVINDLNDNNILLWQINF